MRRTDARESGEVVRREGVMGIVVRGVLVRGEGVEV